MGRRSRTIEEAIGRWTEKELVSPEQAAALRDEAAAEHLRSSRRWGQLLLGIIGGFALLMAAVMFVQRTWAALTGPTQTAIILFAGVLVYLLGVVVGGRIAWRYSGPLLQLGGLVVILLGTGYSIEVWAQGTAGALLIGLLALVVPAVTAARSIREGVAMTGAHTGVSFLFVGMFAHRTLGLEADGVVWVLDAVLVLAVVGSAFLVRSGRPELVDRALAALGVSLWAGLALVALTGEGPLNLGEDAILPADLWLVVVAGVTLWAISRARSEAQLEAFEANLALCVLVGGVLAMTTGAENLGLGSEVWAPMGGVVGGLGILYGLRRESMSVLRAGGAMTLFAMWIFSLAQGGAIGGVLALLATAVLFFWLASRVAGMGGGGDAGGETSGQA